VVVLHSQHNIYITDSVLIIRESIYNLEYWLGVCHPPHINIKL